MTSKEAIERERLIRQQASTWYWRLKSPDFPAHEREEHHRWLAVPEHRAAFEALSADWERWRSMPWPSAPEERVEPVAQTYATPPVRSTYACHGGKAAALDTHEYVISQEAAYWYFACIDDPQLLRSDRREFLAWMRRSPENVAELFKIAQLDGRLRRLKTTIRSLGSSRSKVVERPALSFKLLAVAATTLLVVTLALIVDFNSNNRVIITEASQWARVTLEDGTVLHADARTSLVIHFTATERTVHLYQGSAAFDVAKDPKRPFVVSTSLIDMTAIGTRFGVSIDDGVRTTVSEGIVEVSARGQDNKPVATLRAGQELFVTDDSLTKPVVKRVNAERKLEWRTGWLSFEGETIGQAVQEFNRRNVVQIEIDNPEIAGRMLVYGRFRLDSPHSFAKFIAQPEVLTLVEDSSGKVIRLQPTQPESSRER